MLRRVTLRIPIFPGDGLAFEDFLIDVRIHAWAVHFGVEQPADRENAVTDFFRLQTPHVKPVEEVIQGILAVGIRAERTILHVRIARHDQAVHILERPAIPIERFRQKVKQLRVRRLIPSGSKIIR